MSMVSIQDQPIQQAATEILRRVVSLTTQLFGGVVGIKESFDPEYSNDRYLVFIVETTLGPEDAAARELDWIQQVETIAAGWEQIRLAVRFK